MTDHKTSDDPNEPVVLLVLAAERQHIARRLLEYAVDPATVRTTSEGYVVPRWLAELAGLVLPETPLDQGAGVATSEAGAPAYAISAADVDAPTEQPADVEVEAEVERPAGGRRHKHKGTGK